jgi:hypothetical protein
MAQAVGNETAPPRVTGGLDEFRAKRVCPDVTEDRQQVDAILSRRLVKRPCQTCPLLW